MEGTTYQVIRAKPRNLEAALTEMAREGWDIHSVIPAELSGRGVGFGLFGRGSLEVSEYHIILRRRSGATQ